MLGVRLIRCASSGCASAASSTPPTNKTRATHALPRIEPPVGYEGKGGTLELQLDIDVHQHRGLGLFEHDPVAYCTDHHTLYGTFSLSPTHVAAPVGHHIVLVLGFTLGLRRGDAHGQQNHAGQPGPEQLASDAHVHSLCFGGTASRGL